MGAFKTHLSQCHYCYTRCVIGNVNLCFNWVDLSLVGREELVLLIANQIPTVAHAVQDTKMAAAIWLLRTSQPSVSEIKKLTM